MHVIIAEDVYADETFTRTWNRLVMKPFGQFLTETKAICHMHPHY